GRGAIAWRIRAWLRRSESSRQLAQNRNAWPSDAWLRFRFPGCPREARIWRSFRVPQSPTQMLQRLAEMLRPLPCIPQGRLEPDRARSYCESLGLLAQSEALPARGPRQFATPKVPPAPPPRENDSDIAQGIR